MVKISKRRMVRRFDVFTLEVIMARGNRALKAKHEISVRQKREASWMEYSKDAYRTMKPMTRDRLVRTIEPMVPLAINEAATMARLARAKTALNHCTMKPSTYRGRRVLQGR